MGHKKGQLNWDSKRIAEALKIPEEEVISYFTDGRRISFILERRLAREIIKGKIAESEGKGYDIIDYRGKKYEVRSISKRGVYFNPSYQVGSGRKFEKKGFVKKVNSISGYILCDITTFPNVGFWIVESKEIINWYKEGHLGKNAKISHKKALDLLNHNY